MIYSNLLVFNCCPGSKLASIEMFSAVDNTWVYSTNIPSGAKLGIAAAVLSDSLFLVGGFDTDISSTVERFNILTKRCHTAHLYRL